MNRQIGVKNFIRLVILDPPTKGHVTLSYVCFLIQSVTSTDCMRKQNGMSTRATWQKQQIFKIQDDGQPPFWKWLNRHISVKNCPILMKLGTLHQILNPVTVTWPKVKIFKIQDGGGHHLENRFIAITHQPIVQFQQNLYEEAERHVNKGYGTKKSNFKNPRWRMAAILKIVKSPYLSEKLSDFDEIRYTTANVEPDSRDQKLKVLKFKMARPTSWKSLFWP